MNCMSVVKVWEKQQQLESQGAPVYVGPGPAASAQVPISRAKVVENLYRTTVLLRDFSFLMGLFIMKTQFICKPHFLKLRNLMM